MVKSVSSSQLVHAPLHATELIRTALGIEL